MLETIKKYTNERKQFNTPFLRFYLTQSKLATMASEIYAAESAVYRTVGLFEQRMGRIDR